MWDLSAMNIVSVTQDEDPSKYIIITQQSDINETITNRVFVTENINRSVNVVEIARGVPGFTGPPGKDGVVFDILPIISGGTNNTNFVNNKVIYYDGTRLVSSNYNISDIITGGVLAGTGTVVVQSGGSVVVHSNLGSGLYVNNNNQIVVDFNAIDQRVLQYINITAGSGLVYTNNTFHIGKSSDIVVNSDNIQLSTTGTAGTYTKITTDSKGRVVSGTSINSTDVTTALGYTPWHPGNDGANSELDADKLDSLHASYFLNAANLTGVLPSNIFPKNVAAGSYTKVYISNDSVITGVSNNIYNEIVSSLGYRPVSPTGDNINGYLTINNSVFSSGQIRLYHNLPTFATNHENIDYNEPRGFRFLYGGNQNNPKTGILAYYPGTQNLRLITDSSEIIVTDKLASTLYSSLTGTNSFSGINNFINTVNASLINTSGLTINSTGLINNFNADYLDFKHGSYYLNASNSTGILNASGYPVILSNISGTIDYIPKFDSRTNNPSRTIADSIISNTDDVVTIHDGNLLIGTSNNIELNSTENSLAVGSGNTINAINSVAFGKGHIVSGDYSFAANYQAEINHDFASVFGKHGKTWSDNQIVFGLFNEPTGLDSGLGHGQYSNIGFYYYGQAASFSQMLPNLVFIPKNKAFLYNFDVLMTRLGASGCAAFTFESGIVRNITRRNPDNLAIDENLTVIVKEPVKKVIYNDSYIRDYPLYMESDETVANTTVKIVDNPSVSENSYIDIQNLNQNIILNNKPISVTGSFYSDQSSSDISLVLDKPKTSGYFVQNATEYEMTIYSYDHKAVTGCESDIRFVTSSAFLPSNSGYIVSEIIDNDNFKVNLPFDTGIISGVLGSPDSMRIMLSNPTYEYSNINTIYIRYINGNNVTYGDHYSIGGRMSSSYSYGGYRIFELNNVDDDLLSLIDYDYLYGRVQICPAVANSGSCLITPKRNFSGVFSQSANNQRYKAIKTQFSQEASDTIGYSLINFSGLDPDNPVNSYYYAWSDISGELFDNKNAYIEFAKYIDIQYTTSASYYNTGVPGIIVSTPYSEIRGFHNTGNIVDFDREATLFIDTINTNSIGSYVKTSGGSLSYFNEIFIPYNIQTIATSGQIRLIESGSYVSGTHPTNARLNLSALDTDNKTFAVYVKYISPSSGYKISGYADIYIRPKTVNIDITNVSPSFNRNTNNERCYLNFNQGIEDNNFLIVSNSNPANQTTFSVTQNYNYPTYPSGINGTVRISANKDHGLIVDGDDIYGLVPVVFDDTKNHPKNAIYKIKSINGNNIVIDNSKNYIRNEINKPMYIGRYNGNASGCYGQITFNGNPLDIPGVAFDDSLSKQELTNGDVVDIVSFGGFNSLGYYVVTGIVGTSKFAMPLSGVGNELAIDIPGAGFDGYEHSIIYTKVSSGNCYIPQNYLTYNTEISYLNLYNRWKLNNSGNTIENPSLVRYTLDAYGPTCEPQKACITLTGTFNVTPYEADAIFISFDRPYEFLNRSYSISKIISSNIVHCNPRLDSLTDYSSLAFPISGYAEIIPYHNLNNLVDKNPNQSNVFYEPEITWLQESGSYYANDLSHITGQHLQFFDARTKRQFHALEIKVSGDMTTNGYEIYNNIPSLENPYLIKMSRYVGGSDTNSDKSFNFLINSIKPIEISSLDWKYDNISDGWSNSIGMDNYTPIQNDILELFTETNWNLRIRTDHGTYTSGYKPAAPTFNIFGIKSYSVSHLEFTYLDPNAQQGYWTIDINCSPFNYPVDKNITVSVQDYSGKYDKNIRVIASNRLKLKNVINNTIYSQPNSGWYHLLNIYGVPATGITNLSVSVDNNAGSTHLYAWEPDISGFSFLMSGQSPSSQQTSNLGFTVEYLDQQINQSGTLQTTNSIPVDFKTYNFTDNPIVFQPTCNSYIVSVIVPDMNNNIANLNMNITGINTTSISVGKSDSLKRWLVKAYLNTNTDFGLYPCSFNFTYNSTATTISKNIVIADYLRLEKSELYEPIPLYKNRLWDLEFNINGGVSTKNTQYNSSINVGGLSSIGYYDFNQSTDQYELLSYNINDIYNTGINLHRIYITGNKGLFDSSYFRSTGIHTIGIYLDDGYSSYTDTISVLVSDTTNILNLKDNIYSNFNKQAQISVDTTLSDNITKNNSSKLDGSLTVTTKYDPASDMYKHRVNTADISNIWDAQLLFQDINYPVDDSISQTRVSAQCRGIIDDRIYAVGKLSTLEVSNSYINVPIKISNLSNPIDVNGGAKWNISFNVCYGLADENYPPIITMSGTPTTCSGLPPLLANAPSCYKIRRFDTSSKCWYFEFEGEPLCNPLFGTYPVVIRARDTVDGITILGTDTANTTLRYGPLPVHPAPSISIQPIEGGSNIYPNCSYVRYMWSGSTNIRDLCPLFTGLSGITIIGEIPSGLSLSISEIILDDGTRLQASNGSNYIYESGYGANPFGYGKYYNYYFNNPYTSGAVGYIEGTPSAFFSDPTTISGFVIDYRGADSNTNYSFNDNSNPLTDPIRYTTVYFDTQDYKKLNGVGQNYLSLAAAQVLGPPPNLEGFVYSGIFTSINSPYSGQYFLSDIENQIVTISGINKSMSNLDDVIFAVFSGQPASTSQTYKIFDSSNSSNNRWIKIYSSTINTTFANRQACQFIIPKTVNNFADFGNPSPQLSIDADTNGKLLGAGTYQDNKITGYLRPSYQSYIINNSGNTVYPERSFTILGLHSGLSIEPLAGVCCDHAQNLLIHKNCYESGMSRISGIIVPKPVLETTDPPTVPVYRNQEFRFNIRLAYGYLDSERNFGVNRRDANTSSGLFYLIGENSDTLLDTQAVSSNSLVYQHDDSILTSGSIIKLNLLRPSDTFPTTNPFAIPFVENTYHWIYGYYLFNSNVRTIPNSQDPFPPYVPVNFDKSIYLVSGEPFNISGNLIGGFIPSTQNVCTDNSKTYLMLPNYFNYGSYRPIHTGILSQPLFRSYSGSYFTNVDESSTSLSLKLIDGNITGIYRVNDVLAIRNSILQPTGTKIVGTGMYDNFLVVSGFIDNVSANNMQGPCSITKCISYEKFGQQLKISPKYTELSVNDRINILPVYSGAVFSQSLLSATGNMIIVSGDNNNWYASTNNWSALSSYPNSGFALPYKIISGIINQNLSLTNADIGLWQMSLSGVNTSTLNNDYIYQILTIDNTGLPTATGLNWPLKKFSKTYNLHIVQPFELFYHPTGNRIESTLIVDQPPNSIGWTSTFYINNGIRPLRENPPLIEINNNLYGFDYTLSYNDYYDMYEVNLNSTLPLNVQNIPCLRVSNSYGSQEYNIQS